MKMKQGFVLLGMMSLIFGMSFVLAGCKTQMKRVVPIETVAEQYVHLSAADLQKKADEGDVAAQTTLGYRYEMGVGVEQNDVIAAEWYIVAADEGDPEACYRLALLYGKVGSPLYNQKSARAWLRRAMRLGHAKASVLRYQSGPISPVH